MGVVVVTGMYPHYSREHPFAQTRWFVPLAAVCCSRFLEETPVAVRVGVWRAGESTLF